MPSLGGNIAFSEGNIAFSGGNIAFSGGNIAFSGGIIAFSGGNIAFSEGNIAFSEEILPLYWGNELLIEISAQCRGFSNGSFSLSLYFGLFHQYIEC